MISWSSYGRAAILFEAARHRDPLLLLFYEAVEVAAAAAVEKKVLPFRFRFPTVNRLMRIFWRLGLTIILLQAKMS